MQGITVSPALIWAIIGAILIIAELTTLTFILIFLGIGALVTAALTWFDITPFLSAQLGAFALTSLVLFFVFRKTIKNVFHKSHDVTSEHVGQRCRVVKEIPPGGEGDIQYRGSVWIAFSDSKEAIPEGATVEITDVDGTRLKVKKV